ncbi:MAG: pyrroline-5-carboxylate reductase [Verrucomicrobiae bacterium]|nr:pyrroline-5-carboxylate reductase [Verrucomicrobiae bacterium]
MYEIGFIGCGRMAQVLIRGLIDKNVFSAPQIAASNRSADKLHLFAQKTGIVALPGNREVVDSSRVIVLGVKPTQMGALLEEIKPGLSPGHLLISIATGVSLARLSAFCPAAVRVMPNTPALVGAGASAFAVSEGVTAEQIEFVKGVFSSVGLIEPVEESLMDLVTGLSGSGPAYVYRIIESMTETAVKMGMDPSLALRLATQTVKGAALMVEQTGQSPALLREQVTSPGGTTLEGLKALEEGKIGEVIASAIRAAEQKSRLLGQ